MSNPFKWFVYVSVDGGPWQRHLEFPYSERGREVAVERAVMLGHRVGIEAHVRKERREVKASHGD
jgi:hypothetical protein